MASLFWSGFARIVRGELLSLRERDFVLVARHLGVSERRILWRHLLPQLRSQIGVTAAFAMTMHKLTEGRFSLGLGRGIAPMFAAYGLPSIKTAEIEDFVGLMRRICDGVAQRRKIVRAAKRIDAISLVVALCRPVDPLVVRVRNDQVGLSWLTFDAGVHALFFGSLNVDHGRLEGIPIDLLHCAGCNDFGDDRGARGRNASLGNLPD